VKPIRKDYARAQVQVDKEVYQMLYTLFLQAAYGKGSAKLKAVRDRRAPEIEADVIKAVKVVFATDPRRAAEGVKAVLNSPTVNRDAAEARLRALGWQG